MRIQVLRNVTSVLSRREKLFAVAALVISIGSSLFDLIGVAILGIMGSLAISGVQSRMPGTRVSTILNSVGLENESLQTQMTLLGTAAVFLLLVKTFFTYFGNKYIYLYFGRQSAKRTAQILNRILSLPKNSEFLSDSQRTLYLTTGGVTNLYLGVIATSITTLSDIALALLLFSGLIFITPSLGMSTLLYFTLVGFALFLFLRSRTVKLAEEEVEFGITSNSIVLESLRLQRELIVRNTVNSYIDRTLQLRTSLSNTIAIKSLLPNISKYAMEASLTLGIFIIAAIQFALTDASHAVAGLSLFAASGTRIAPSVLRVQQGALTISAALQMSAPTLNFLLTESCADEIAKPEQIRNSNVHEGIQPLHVQNLHFRYSKESSFAVANVSFAVNANESLGIVGISGSGKSTLVDLCLGHLVPEKGEVALFETNPTKAFKAFPGSVAYVPQQIEIVNGTIAENIALGLSPIDEAQVLKVLENVGLLDFVSQLPDKYNTVLGENGSKLSGGQRQKIGIARALYTQPKLLFLDEATSSLDSESEEVITSSIQELEGKCALIVIAHRISTIKNLDKIMLITEGRVEAVGSFKELIASNQTFKRMIETNSLLIE